MGNRLPDRPVWPTSRTPDEAAARPTSHDPGDASWAGLDIRPEVLSRYTVAVCLRPDGTTYGEESYRPRWIRPHSSGPVVGAGPAQTCGGPS